MNSTQPYIDISNDLQPDLEHDDLHTDAILDAVYIKSINKEEHILIIVLHPVSVMCLLFAILTVVILQGNQATLARLASIHPCASYS